MRPALIPPLLAIAWGLNWPAVKTMLSVLAPFSARGLGLGLGVFLLFGLALLRRTPLLPQRAAWPAVLIGGVLTVAVFNMCTAFAQLTTSTSRAAVLTFTMPLMSAALAWAVLGERPDRKSALALGGAGIVVLAVPVLRGLAAPVPVAAHAGSAWGLLFPLGAALAWALGTVATKRWPPPGDRIVITAWQLGIGAACATLAALATGERLPALWPPRVLVALAWHVLIATAVGVLGAMALVGDRPSGADWLGFVLVLGGAALVVLPMRVSRA